MNAMVLVYKPELTHSVWQDFDHKRTTRNTLEKELRQGVATGQWVAWRIMTIEKEVYGDAK